MVTTERRSTSEVVVVDSATAPVDDSVELEVEAWTVVVARVVELEAMVELVVEPAELSELTELPEATRAVDAVDSALTDTASTDTATSDVASPDTASSDAASLDTGSAAASSTDAVSAPVLLHAATARTTAMVNDKITIMFVTRALTTELAGSI